MYPFRFLEREVSVSAQDGIVALWKAHTYSTPSLSSLPKVALETVPMFVWLNTDLPRPWGVECRLLPFSILLSFRRSVLWFSDLSMFRKFLKPLSTSALPSCRPDVISCVLDTLSQCMSAFTLRRLIYRERHTAVSISIWSVMVYLGRRIFQDCVVYCLLPSNIDVLCCIANRTVSVLFYMLYLHKDHLLWTTSGTLLICHCLQCSQSCHQLTAKHFDVIHYWPWIFCFLGQLQWPNLLSSSGCCH